MQQDLQHMELPVESCWTSICLYNLQKSQIEAFALKLLTCSSKFLQGFFFSFQSQKPNAPIDFQKTFFKLEETLAPPSQKIYFYFHFIKIRPIKYTPDIFWIPSVSCCKLQILKKNCFHPALYNFVLRKYCIDPHAFLNWMSVYMILVLITL